LTGSGTDAFGTLPGISLHTELAMLSSFGLTNRQVIAAATGNFALLWGWTHLGKIAPGREADILVLEANPLDSLENLKRIHMLWLDGQLIQPEKLLKP
jgi:imidazolonepropionase-like amidohydrolase